MDMRLICDKVGPRWDVNVSGVLLGPSSNVSLSSMKVKDSMMQCRPVEM